MRANVMEGASRSLAAAGLLLASAAALGADAAALERRLKLLEEELAALRKELATLQKGEPAQEQQIRQVQERVSAVETAAREPVQKVEERVGKLESLVQAQRMAGNMVFFRGGYTELTDDRGYGAATDMWGLGPALGAGTINNNDSGWNVGAGFDFLLSRDTWGLFPGVWALAELGVEFSHIDSETTPLVVPTAICTLVGSLGGSVTPCVITGEDHVTMLTVSAAPKVKLFEGAKFRPWLVPIGLDFRVINPASDSVGYVDVGGEAAAGADYEVLPGVRLGADFRYHFAAEFTNPDYSPAAEAAIQALGLKVQEPSSDYWTAGGYLGISF